jgi:hypothetical protein
MAPWKRRRTDGRGTTDLRHTQRRLLEKIHLLSVRAKEVRPQVMAEGRGRRNAASRQGSEQVPIGAATRDEIPRMQMAGTNPAIASFMGSFHLHRGQSSGSTLTMAAP